MKYKCVVADLDGTLLNSNKEISARTRRELENLMKNGIHFVPATGRAYFAIPKAVLELEGIRYAIASNGMAIYDVRTQKAVSRLGMEEKLVKELLALLKEEAVIWNCIYEGRPYTSLENYNNPNLGNGNKVKADYIRATRTPVADMQAFILEHASELDGIDLTVLPDDRERIRSKIEGFCSAVYITSSAPDILEISNADGGKHRGIRRLCELLGLDGAEVAAFGDNDNDVEMLAEAGLGIAVENATVNCKAAADRVVGSNDEDGVAEMIAKFWNFPAG